MIIMEFKNYNNGDAHVDARISKTKSGFGQNTNLKCGKHEHDEFVEEGKVELLLTLLYLDQILTQ